jgi:four helix bundle protein
MGDFKKLSVWRKAHHLTLMVYAVTQTFPKAEQYGLVSQIRRSSASIGANLAEGSGRRGDGEFGRFIRIAIGSASELEYHFLLARDLYYMQEEDYCRLSANLREVGGMLAALLRTVRSSTAAVSEHLPSQ